MKAPHGDAGKHPRDRFITIFGRKPVLEALDRPDVRVAKLLVAQNAHGGVVRDILARAKARGVPVRRVLPREVTRLSRNGRQDQGVVADVEAPRMESLADWLRRLPAPEADPAPRPLLVLDGLTNPQNVGMILRSATAAGVAGVVLPRSGCPEVGPLVVKASAGVAFEAAILRVEDVATGLDALAGAGFRLLGLDGRGTETLFEVGLTLRTALVVGNETAGLGREARARLHGLVRIPIADGVESLNAAVAASLAAFELVRRPA